MGILFALAFGWCEARQVYPQQTQHTGPALYEKYEIDRTGPQVSRGDVDRETPLGEFELTAYCLTGTMANGQQVHAGAVAVDPQIIPLGTRLRIEGLGEFVASDTGAVIDGRIIDVWLGSYDAAVAFGRQRKKVWIIEN